VIESKSSNGGFKIWVEDDASKKASSSALPGEGIASASWNSLPSEKEKHKENKQQPTTWNDPLKVNPSLCLFFFPSHSHHLTFFFFFFSCRQPNLHQRNSLKLLLLNSLLQSLWTRTSNNHSRPTSSLRSLFFADSDSFFFCRERESGSAQKPPSVRQRLDGKGESLKQNPLKNFVSDAPSSSLPPAPSRIPLAPKDAPKNDENSKPSERVPLQPKTEVQPLVALPKEDIDEDKTGKLSGYPSPTMTIHSKEAMQIVMGMFCTPLETPQNAKTEALMSFTPSPVDLLSPSKPPAPINAKVSLLSPSILPSSKTFPERDDDEEEKEDKENAPPMDTTKRDSNQASKVTNGDVIKQELGLREIYPSKDGRTTNRDIISSVFGGEIEVVSEQLPAPAVAQE
jgi:hypothetical protein